MEKRFSEPLFDLSSLDQPSTVDDSPKVIKGILERHSKKWGISIWRKKECVLYEKTFSFHKVNYK
jgi:hypothetical protein